jgi:uncharacterized protein (DUF1330 family)
MIAEVEVQDTDAYAEYRAGTPAAVAAYGGRFIVRGGAVEPKEGPPPAGRVVVIEFADMATARRFYDSPEYQKILPIRLAASKGRVFMVEGA